MTQLGRLVRLDLRDTWKTEDRDFTPWLAEEDNLTLLGDTLGIDLELEAVEQNVGPFRADILCKDTLSNRWVLVENQLERTDHTHLGQLMTYAAGLDAVTIVWIAARAADEHRAAMDWLNEITDSEVRFFLLEVELWKIGESPAAPKFNVVSKPNDWSKSAETGEHLRQDLTSLKRQYLEYWTQFSAKAAEHAPRLRFSKPKPSQYITLGLGGGMYCYCAIRASDKTIACGITIQANDAKVRFQELYARKADIEEELGFELDWLEKPDTQRSGIRVEKTETDPTDESDWPRQHKWLVETAIRMHRTFKPQIAQLSRSASDLGQP